MVILNIGICQLLAECHIRVPLLCILTHDEPQLEVEDPGVDA